MCAASLLSALASGNLHKYVADLCFALDSANIHSGPPQEARQRKRRRIGELAATMATLSAKNLPWQPCHLLPWQHA